MIGVGVLRRTPFCPTTKFRSTGLIVSFLIILEVMRVAALAPPPTRTTRMMVSRAAKRARLETACCMALSLDAAEAPVVRRVGLGQSPGKRSDVGDPKAGVSLVAPVDRDEVGRERLDLVGVAEASAEEAADARDGVGQLDDRVAGVAVL